MICAKLPFVLLMLLNNIMPHGVIWPWQEIIHFCWPCQMQLQIIDLIIQRNGWQETYCDQYEVFGEVVP